MMRLWHQAAALVGDLVPGGVPAAGGGLLILTVVGALLWYWFPEWLFGLGRAARAVGRAVANLRWPWRRRHRGTPEPEPEPEPLAEEEPDEELPAVPAASLTLSADELAAQGRFKEAVRERLRAIVRDLVERGVVEHRPGWTITELAATASWARPAAASPLGRASEIFSGIWYGLRDATAADDAAMREHAAAVRAVLDGQRVPA